MKKTFNIAKYLPEMAEAIPYQKAVVLPQDYDSNGKRKYTFLTFAQLEALCNRFGNAMLECGIKKGTRTLLMVRPSLEFIAITFALFKIGAVPILIDPGMGRKRLLECIKGVEPEAIVAIPLAFFVKQLYSSYFKSVKYNIVVGKTFKYFGENLIEIAKTQSEDLKFADTYKDTMAAILFTSGSTGPAKGVVYEHGMFDAQVKLLKKVYGFCKGEVDLAGLPVFALFDTALGMTCVIPDMDPARPSKVNPVNIIEAIEDNGVTTSFGSPAIWKNVATYCLKHRKKLPSIKRILMAGAPVPLNLILKFKEILVKGDIYTPYGATESLPVASISGRELLEKNSKLSFAGRGMCVGRVVDSMHLKLIEISDDIISEFREKFAPQEEICGYKIGEFIVKGPSVTKKYYRNRKANLHSKIYEGEEVWHRIGDVGYIDKDGLIWFCGRKSHRVVTKHGTLYTVPCESIFNLHPCCSRSALVGIPDEFNPGFKEPVIIIEPKLGYFPKNVYEERKFKRELLNLANQFEITKQIKTILFHKSFPVDVRHNAKIFREKLAKFAQRKLK